MYKQQNKTKQNTIRKLQQIIKHHTESNLWTGFKCYRTKWTGLQCFTQHYFSDFSILM